MRPPVTPITLIPPSMRKRKRSSIAPVAVDDSDIDDEIVYIAAAQDRARADNEHSETSQHRSYLVNQLERALSDTSGDVEMLRNRFKILVSHALRTIPNIKKLSNFSMHLEDERFLVLFHSLIVGIREEQPLKSVVDLLLTDFSNSSNTPLIIDAVPEVSSGVATSSTAKPIEEIHEKVYEVNFQMLVDQACETSMREFEKSQTNEENELARLEKYLTRKKCKLIDVEKDGNCLYHALTLALHVCGVANAPGDHIELRRELVEFMASRSPDWFVLPANETHLTFLERQRLSGQWGDENVVKAAAEHYKRTINVTSVNEKTRTFDFAAQGRGRKPTPIELVLVCLQHYMYGCPYNKTQLISGNVEKI